MSFFINLRYFQWTESQQEKEDTEFEKCQTLRLEENKWPQTVYACFGEPTTCQKKGATDFGCCL